MVFLRRLPANRYPAVRARLRPRMASRTRQRGVFAIMSAVLMTLILAFCGLALGLGQIYNRKVELDGMARAVALAAARELNGTPQGITAAVTRATATASNFKYNYRTSFTLSDAAISFSSSPLKTANWMPAVSAAASPANIFYVAVDTSKLDTTVGTVVPVFMQFVSKSLATVQLSDRAVAGRTGVKVTPLAICALDKDHPGIRRGAELVEYGFRRGVSYNLMRLNPGGTTAENFVIDPTVSPGEMASSYHTSIDMVGPFVCTGTMWMPRVTGGNIQVSRNFPIASLYKQLNARFGDYTDGLCSPNGAPPDLNIKPFKFGTGNWMSPAQTQPNAAMTSGQALADGKLRTVADPITLPTGTTTKLWGPLWAYAKAAKFSSYVVGQPEPPTGYATFSTTDLQTMYQTGLSTSGYPTALQGGTPYRSSVTSPSHKALAEENRRVLNIPLLSCPVPAGSDVNAKVVAVGKFFMTVPATSDSVSAEFAGVASDQSYAGVVELFP